MDEEALTDIEAATPETVVHDEPEVEVNIGISTPAKQQRLYNRALTPPTTGRTVRSMKGVRGARSVRSPTNSPPIGRKGRSVFDEWARTKPVLGAGVPAKRALESIAEGEGVVEKRSRGDESIFG